MAEVAAGLYAAETVVEGAVLGGVAVGKPTVPLHAKFQKVKSPSPLLARSNHTLNVITNRAYIFGGDSADGDLNSDMHVFTLPTNLAEQDLDVDYQLRHAEAAPVRPLVAYSDDLTPKSEAYKSNEIPSPRSGHAATVVGTNIYIFGGRTPTTSSEDVSQHQVLQEDGVVHASSTSMSKWTTLYPHLLQCSQGLPVARMNASLTSSPHPLPSSSVSTEPSTDTEHNSGTLFLHSGYSSSSSHTALRDVWIFDISSRVWLRWADDPTPSAEETAGEGRLLCFESRLWRVGDGVGIVHYFDIVRDRADDAWGQADSEIGVSPKSGEWVKLSFHAEQTPGEEPEASLKHEQAEHPTAKADLLPLTRRSAGFLPITTGAGREYLLYFLGADAPGSRVQDLWSFQIASEAKSMAKAKDKTRGLVGKSGENHWARCEVIDATKTEGELERPQGLEGFAASVWSDFGGAKLVLWGGKSSDGRVQNEGWILNIE